MLRAQARFWEHCVRCSFAVAAFGFPARCKRGRAEVQWCCCFCCCLWFCCSCCLKHERSWGRTALADKVSVHLNCLRFHPLHPSSHRWSSPEKKKVQANIAVFHTSDAVARGSGTTFGRAQSVRNFRKFRELPAQRSCHLSAPCRRV